MDLDELRAERQALNNDVLLHAASVGDFRAPGQPWFKLKQNEPSLDDGEPVHHLSTSASCFESLADVPDHQKGRKDAKRILDDTVNGFAKAALGRRKEKWQSEGAAEIYSRVRTLPILLAQASGEALDPFAGKLRNHVIFVWDQLDPTSADAQGIAERVRKSSSKKDAAKQHEQRYPPNSFHTCWALRLIDAYERRREIDPFGLTALPAEIEQKRTVALLWCSRTLSVQTALIRGDAQRVDAQQLAWAMIADYEGWIHASKGDRDAPSTIAGERRELYASALDAFFSEQSDHGTWPLYEPLFHFPRAGNAYCYSFETLAELLRPALLRKEGRQLRELLKPYLPKLICAHDLATRTRVELQNGGIGWCSGHHPHRREAEAWATAAVFSYLQALRRLVGHWAAEAARDELAVRKSRYASRANAEAMLAERGRTWTDGKGLSVGRELAGLFVHPVQAQASEQAEIDPDRPLIPKDDARSAILFGPPGTGKTTLVEAVAGAIDWDFVEVPASAFVSEGMDRVPARAESIFTQLMELDRCVVLFDEVDELIRGRRGDDSDPFGRFLTTSMLPKLARLWNQRRVLFFVATNNVDKADPAIRRSQRFDAAIFTAPSSFEVKRKRLEEHGVDLPREFTLEQVEEALETTEAEGPLGVFALLRWDQTPELASRVTVVPGDDTATIESLTEALRKMGEELSRLEYHDEDANNEPIPLFEVWEAYRSNARRDFGRPLVARVNIPPDALPDGWKDFPSSNGAAYVDLHAATDSLAYDDGDRCELRDGNGYLAVDEGQLLNFVKDGSTGDEAQPTG